MPPKPAPIFSQPSPVIPRHPNHQHDIVTALVAVETLDTLPGDLTKTFGDLRELDAVLNSTTASLTHKLRSLTKALQTIHPDVNPGWGLPLTKPKSALQVSATDPGTLSATTTQVAITAAGQAATLQPSESSPSRPLNRFQSLLEIAEELTRYKIGVEDKVRVSGQACDTVSPASCTPPPSLLKCFQLIAHQAHLQALLSNSSIFLPTQMAANNEIIHDWEGHITGKRARLSPPGGRVLSTNGGIPHTGSDYEPTGTLARNANGTSFSLGELTPSKRRKTGKEKGAVAIGLDSWEDREAHENGRSPTLAKKLPNAALSSNSAKDGRHVLKKRR